MKPRLLPALFGSCALLSFAGVQAADVVSVSCTAGKTTALITMDETGMGTLQAQAGEQAMGCGLKLGVLEGPPFGESMTGMLVLTFDRAKCEPASANRGLLPEISLHIEDPLGVPASGMTVINRRPVVFDCTVAGFDLAAIRQLSQQNADIRIRKEN